MILTTIVAILIGALLGFFYRELFRAAGIG